MFGARHDSSGFEVFLRDPSHVKHLDKAAGLRFYQKSLDVGHPGVICQIGEQLAEGCESQLGWWNLQVDQLLIHKLDRHPLLRQEMFFLRFIPLLQSLVRAWFGIWFGFGFVNFAEMYLPLVALKAWVPGQCNSVFFSVSVVSYTLGGTAEADETWDDKEHSHKDQPEVDVPGIWKRLLSVSIHLQR